MPTTRSSTRLITNSSSAVPSSPTLPINGSGRKRKASSEVTDKVDTTKKKKKASAVTVDVAKIELVDEDEKTKLVPAVLTFDFEKAKKHLVEQDHRFAELFSKMKCRPFEQLEQVHPFRYECSDVPNFCLS